MRIAKRNLKKQSQFLKGQINANVYISKDYKKKCNRTSGENKPNSKPIQSQTPDILRHTAAIFLAPAGGGR